ncbi:MAG: peptidoglycan DD-metalloendopeptidase family protein [Bacteroidota bacterium]
MMKRNRTLIFLAPVIIIAALAIYFVPVEPVFPTKQIPQQVTAESKQADPAPAKLLYGIPVDSFLVHRSVVHRGESLADILVPHRITPQQVYKISLLPDSIINERKIKPGNSYTVFFSADTLPTWFVYEKDPLNYVVIGGFQDSIYAENRLKPVERKLQFASGTIESSLWESMQSTGTNPILAVELSEILAWSIDFFGIQQGDRYKVIYEEAYVDSLSIGITHILGTWFYHNNTDFWGIPFEQDGVESFFDDQGNSLRKAFLKAPLRFSRISSGFSNSRYHPVLKIRRPHHGVDYAAATGTPVHTVGDGVVTKTGYQKSGGGNYVKIKHNSVYSTTYMHLSRFGKGIRSGTYVKQGDVIGYVGSTGLATGPHLDFRFYKNGSAVNPLRVEAPPVEPVFEENLQAYKIRKSLTISLLKLI